MDKPQLALILASVSTPEQAKDEKQSLDTQESDLRAIADARRWPVFAVLRIPGFSRNYISWEECAQDMLAEGITAMADLKRFTDEKAYQVLMVRDADRFGRTQSLIMQIAETICIRHRLKIYSQIDNTLVEGEAARFWAAMTGLRSAGEMDKKKLYREKGMDKRAELGFYESHTPWFHRTVHDPETGKALRVELREEYRYIFDAIFKVVVEQRIGFNEVEKVLHDQYQIVNPSTGRPFRPMAIYETLHSNPCAWGHRHRGRRLRLRNGNRRTFGEWVYDPNIPPPPDVTLYYDVLPPIYSGDQADAMKDELRRRRDITGGAKPTQPSMFTGLVVCDYCDNHMVHTHRKDINWRSYRCQTHDRFKRVGQQDCAARRKTIRYETLEIWLRAFLAKLLAGEPLEALFPSPTSDAETELASIEQQIAAITAEKTRLIERLGLIPDTMLPDYQRQMQSVAERADALMQRHTTLKAATHAQDRRGQVAAFAELSTIGLDAFMQSESGRQQQLLKRLFAGWRIIVADGEVVSVAQAGRRNNRP